MLKFCTCGHRRSLHTQLRLRYRCNARNCYCLLYIPITSLSQARA
jgi:hypothetical protein